MINRELKPYKVISFEPTTDLYGQKHTKEISSRMVEMVVKLYRQTNPYDDVRYVDIDMIALTFDKEITDANQIEIDGKRFAVKYVNPSGRLHQILLKKV